MYLFTKKARKRGLLLFIVVFVDLFLNLLYDDLLNHLFITFCDLNGKSIVCKGIANVGKLLKNHLDPAVNGLRLFVLIIVELKLKVIKKIVKIGRAINSESAVVVFM